MSKEKYLYLRNGSIWTGDAATQKAEALIIGNGKILALGKTADLDAHPFIADSICLELEGVSVIPGMSDCHLHVLTCAKGMQSIDMSSAKCMEDVIEKLRQRSSKVEPRSWIYGTMLNENNWDRPVLPDADDLDKAGIDNPSLSTGSVRMLQLPIPEPWNFLAFSGWTSRNKKDSSGKPTGVLVEGAQLPVYSVMKKELYKKETLLKYLDCYLNHAAALGLTTLHSCSASSLGMEEELGLYQVLLDEDRLRCRVYSTHDELSQPSMGGVLGNGFVRFEGFKLFLDGSLGARTAAISFPYADDPDTKGMLIHELEGLIEKLCESTRREDHILVHAIGDRAIDQMLDAIEKTCSIFPDPRYPYLLNHVEIIRPDQIERMKKLPVACVIQPTYVPSDIDMVPTGLGRIRNLPVYGKILLTPGCCFADQVTHQ